jgi:anti-sigma regulatory factor (Ser/Thr protein kinase)
MTSVRSAEIMLDPHPSSVGRARRWLSRQLEEWGLEDLDYDVSVVLSELVTNAVLHARTQIELRVTYSDLLRLEVCDTSARMPSPRGHAISTTTGRGLHLVAALASSWGYEPTPAGKTVWAEFTDIDASRGPRPAGNGGGEATVSALGPRGGTCRVRSASSHCLERIA